MPESGDLHVRPAEPGDAAAIRAVHEAAFPTRLEADLVERLERDGDVVVSLVAAREDEVAGHLLLSRMEVVADGRPRRALGLGPVAVVPPLQRAGVGSALIRGALAIARATGEEFVFVLGEPEYYQRFGFSAATAAPFASPYAGPYLMAIAFGDAPAPAAGTAAYAPAFTLGASA
ncbi:N-acetyltransferase [Sphingomonas parva]|uniref:N-acetyltransferase n=1 Tax=Sphingomonas parva TaxID=2555898 RepID=A0A4Y8ZPU7_9SPHN|nr:N-acetyltransferase [Sphingomonas parva]